MLFTTHNDLSFELYQGIENKIFLMQKNGVMRLLGARYTYQFCSMNTLTKVTA